MDLRDSHEEAAFRAEVRQWLQDNLPEGWGTPAFKEPEDPEEHVKFLKEWQGKLASGGWAGINWPKEYGGRAVTVLQKIIFEEEYEAAYGPDMIHLAVGLDLVGPVLITAGEQWQKERFVGPCLKGEEIWCQGFSEPGAGSDLAALQTRGEIDGDELVINGQKIWTSFAHHADFCILVVRTNTEVKKHKGLTFVIVDMKSPGIEIRPLVEMTGHQWFNEVFFENVRVPLKNVVGGIDKGWGVVMETLNVERSSASQHSKLDAQIARLIKTAKAQGIDKDPLFRQELARTVTDSMVLKMTAYRNASAFIKSGESGPEGSIIKLFWADVDQRFKNQIVNAMGPAGLALEGDPAAADQGYWQHQLLWSKASSIYAGTSEIQRNIIATRVLGLPR